MCTHVCVCCYAVKPVARKVALRKEGSPVASVKSKETVLKMSGVAMLGGAHKPISW